jgi:dienelactone hydrolase
MEKQFDPHRHIRYPRKELPHKVLGRLIVAIFSVASFAASMAVTSAYAASKTGVLVLANQMLPSGYSTDIYLPRTARLQGGRREDSLPLVVFLPGAFVDKSQYASVASFIAGAGFVVVIPNPIGLFLEVNTVNDLLDDISIADKDPGSPLHKVVDTNTLFVSGHSLGGAIGLYALTGTCAPQICSTFPNYSAPEALIAGAFYGTNLVEAGSLIELDPPASNVIIVQGSNDSIAVTDEAIKTYSSFATSRALVEIAGADHYGVCNDPALSPPVTQDPTEGDPDPPLPQAEANRRIAFWLATWFKSRLMD